MFYFNSDLSVRGDRWNDRARLRPINNFHALIQKVVLAILLVVFVATVISNIISTNTPHNNVTTKKITKKAKQFFEAQKKLAHRGFVKSQFALLSVISMAREPQKTLTKHF